MRHSSPRLGLAAALAVFSCCCTAAAQGQGPPHNLSVEFAPSPALNVDIDWNPRPRFGWRLPSGMAAQASYRLWVATDPNLASVVWDSGVVSSPSTSQVQYGGASSLLHDADYWWVVAVSSSSPSVAGPTSMTNSSVAAFSTGLDGTAAWASGAVVGGQGAPPQWLAGCTAGQASPQLRLSFSLAAGAVVRARVYATAFGLYSLHLNGQRVGGGDDVLTPGWATVPSARLLAQGWDVAASLADGAENVLGMRLGEGKYGYVREFCAAGDSSCLSGIAVLSITQRLADGSLNRTFVTTGPGGPGSTGWQCSPSPIVFQHLFGGETYNASLEQRGWDAPGFVPLPGAPAWTPAVVQQSYVNASVISPHTASPVRVMQSLSPLSVVPGPGLPYVGGGSFVTSKSGPNVYWVAANATVKNFVVSCSMCGLDVCSYLVTVTDAYLSGLTTGANFSCSQLPTSASSFVADMGRNMAGFCTFSLPPSAEAGAVVSFAHGEIMGPAGGVENTFGASAPPRGCNVNVINCADQLDQYVYGGPDDATEGPVFTPTFTFHGFRYIAIFGYPSTAPAPTPDQIVCRQTYSGMGPAGGLALNGSLAQIQAAIVRTQQSNFLSIPSDCPTREKRGWMGDAQVSAHEALSNLDAVGLYETWARTFSDILFMGCSMPPASSSSNSTTLSEDLAKVVPSSSAAAAPASAPPVRPAAYVCCANRSEFGCQPGVTPYNATGSLPDVVPFDSISGWPGDILWEAAGEVIPHALLLSYANLPALELLWPYITSHMAFIVRAAVPSTGLQHWGSYGDWLAAEGVSTPFAENFQYIQLALLASEMAAALGNAQEAAAYTALAASVSAAAVTAFFDPAASQWDGGANYNAQSMALSMSLGGSATASAAPAIAAHMAADVAARGFHPTGGLISVRWCLQGLVAGNRSDLSLSVATVPTAPGWAYESTPDMPGTIWEAWTGDATHSSGSKNHPFLAGGIGVWLYETAAGVSLSHRVEPQADDIQVEEEEARTDEAVAASALGFDPRARGLTASETLAALAAADASIARVRSGQGAASFDELLAHISALGVPPKRHAAGSPSSTSSFAQMRPVFTAAPDATIARSLGEAGGWRSGPSGNASAYWKWSPPPSDSSMSTASSFALTATVPPSVFGRLALPLSLIRELAVSSAVYGDARLRVHSASTAVTTPLPLMEDEVEIVQERATLVLDAVVRFVPESSAAASSSSFLASTLAAGCESLGQLHDTRETVVFCPRALPATSSSSSSSAAAQAAPVSRRLASWPDVEGRGRVAFDGVHSRLPCAATGSLLLEVRHGAHRAVVTPEA